MLSNAAIALKTGQLQLSEPLEEKQYGEYLTEKSPNSLIKEIRINDFKQASIQNIEGKLAKHEEIKSGVSPAQSDNSPVLGEAFRLPNASLRTASLTMKNGGAQTRESVVISPTGRFSQIYDNLQLLEN